MFGKGGGGARRKATEGGGGRGAGGKERGGGRDAGSMKTSEADEEEALEREEEAGRGVCGSCCLGVIGRVEGCMPPGSRVRKERRALLCDVWRIERGGEKLLILMEEASMV